MRRWSWKVQGNYANIEPTNSEEAGEKSKDNQEHYQPSPGVQAGLGGWGREGQPGGSRSAPIVKSLFSIFFTFRSLSFSFFPLHLLSFTLFQHVIHLRVEERRNQVYAERINKWMRFLGFLKPYHCIIIILLFLLSFLLPFWVESIFVQHLLSIYVCCVMSCLGSKNVHSTALIHIP